MNELYQASAIEQNIFAKNILDSSFKAQRVIKLMT